MGGSIRYRVLFLLLGIFICGGRLTAGEVQDDTLYHLRVPDAAFLEDFRGDPVFDYRERAEQSTFWEQLSAWMTKHLFRSSSRTMNNVIVWALEVLAVFAVLFLLYRLIRNGINSPFRKRVKAFAPEELTLEICRDEVGYRELLEHAVKEADYVLAVRLHFLYLLHLLDERKMVRWDIHKTNLSYYYEIRDDAVRKEFGNLSRIFDYVCYGEFPIDQELYREVEKQFVIFRGGIL